MIIEKYKNTPVTLGDTAGRLTLVSRTAGKVKHWDCLCECGNTESVPEVKIRHGQLNRCHKCRKVNSYEAGTVIGNLVLVHKDTAPGQRSSWICQCKVCGDTKSYQASSLKRRSSCGKESCRFTSRFEDYTGKKFGMLTAIKRLGRRKGKLSGPEATWWSLRCDCGKEVERSMGYVLGYQDYINCGCVSSQRSSVSHLLSDFGGVKNGAYGQHLSAARSRGLRSDLTKEQYLEIVSKPCFYCGDMSVRKRKGVAGGEIKLNSADRLNNEPYYTLQNTVSACFICQRMKGAMTFEAFKQKLHDILVKHPGGLS